MRGFEWRGGGMMGGEDGGCLEEMKKGGLVLSCGGLGSARVCFGFCLLQGWSDVLLRNGRIS